MQPFSQTPHFENMQGTTSELHASWSLFVISRRTRKLYPPEVYQAQSKLDLNWQCQGLGMACAWGVWMWLYMQQSAKKVFLPAFCLCIHIPLSHIVKIMEMCAMGTWLSPYVQTWGRVLKCVRIELAGKKNNKQLGCFVKCNCHESCINHLWAWRSLPYSQFGVTAAWEITETENTIHFELHAFCIFHILARLACFVGAWLDVEIHVTPWFWCYCMQARNSTLRIPQI